MSRCLSSYFGHVIVASASWILTHLLTSHTHNPRIKFPPHLSLRAFCIMLAASLSFPSLIEQDLTFSCGLFFWNCKFIIFSCHHLTIAKSLSILLELPIIKQQSFQHTTSHFSSHIYKPNHSLWKRGSLLFLYTLQKHLLSFKVSFSSHFWIYSTLDPLFLSLCS